MYIYVLAFARVTSLTNFLVLLMLRSLDAQAVWFILQILHIFLAAIYFILSFFLSEEISWWLYSRSLLLASATYGIVLWKRFGVGAVRVIFCSIICVFDVVMY